MSDRDQNQDPDRPTDDAVGAARRTIDAVDREVLKLLAKRFDAIRDIAAAKRDDADQPFFDGERERRILESWTDDARALGLPVPLAREVLREILRYSRRVQEPLLNAADAGQRTGPLRVSIQGMGDCYSGLAARRLLATRSPSEVEIVEYHTFSEAVDRLEDAGVDYSLLPVENSIIGSILDVNRLICDRQLCVVDEEIWAVQHSLAALPGARLEDIREVRSHPAALAQCERFLREMDGVSRESWYDTAGAAQSIVDDARPDVAAICSAEAATSHGLVVLAKDVADHERNETRFLLLAREAETPDPRLPCKTSMVFRLNHHEGALSRVLQAFAAAAVNLLRIESRPNPDTPWEYLFFVDVEGHQDETKLIEALHAVKRCCNHLRIVGTYPRRTHRDSPVDQPIGPRLAAEPLAVESVPESAPELAPEPAPVATGERQLLSEPGRSGDRSTVRIGGPRGATIGGGGFTLIAGPCAVESRDQIIDAARMVRAAGASLLRGGAFKPRTSPYSFQGLGVEGLRLLQAAGREFGLPVVTELVRIEDIPAVVAHADMIQVGARNMQNFPMLRELGQIDRPVLLKRGMSATIKELLLAAEYILSAGNQQVVLCERGIRTFETSTRGTLDVAAVPVLRQRTHLPIIVDPSHAAGDRELVVPLALAAVAAGADGLIVEAHPRPDEALCDREQALTVEQLRQLVRQAAAIVKVQGREWHAGPGADPGWTDGSSAAG